MPESARAYPHKLTLVRPDPPDGSRHAIPRAVVPDIAIALMTELVDLTGRQARNPSLALQNSYQRLATNWLSGSHRPMQEVNQNPSVPFITLGFSGTGASTPKGYLGASITWHQGAGIQAVCTVLAAAVAKNGAPQWQWFESAGAEPAPSTRIPVKLQVLGPPHWKQTVTETCFQAVNAIAHAGYLKALKMLGGDPITWTRVLLNDNQPGTETDDLTPQSILVMPAGIYSSNELACTVPMLIAQGYTFIDPGSPADGYRWAPRVSPIQTPLEADLLIVPAQRVQQVMNVIAPDPHHD